MFGNNSKKDNNMSSSSAESTMQGGINSLGPGTKVIGDLMAQTDIRIDGELEGNLKCEGKVILGPKGIIKGNIDCQSAVVEGTISGVLRVKELLQIKETAHITGEIATDKLMVQSGAVFNVKCEMGGQKIVPKAALSTAKMA
jgi:cytoskeletal protein CcmA (bactofilin family)